jgi:hypothetical protein
VPEPVSGDTVRAEWAALSSQPELACAAAWSSACRTWWDDPADPRLRERASDVLVLGRDEIAAWLARRLDPKALIRAHEHVTTMRAGIERDQSHRQLTTGALRSHTVLAVHRGGARTVFMDARRAAAEVARLGDTLEALPAHPFVRAAWLVQAIGAVHPFADANGGTSRFLASLELVRAQLPPLVLTVTLRNGAYIDGLMRANHTAEIGPFAIAFQDMVQGSVATALLDSGPRAAWDAAMRARAERWAAVVDAGWRQAIGASLEDSLARDALATPAARGAVIARLMRRGYRVPCAPEPLLAHWGCSASGCSAWGCSAWGCSAWEVGSRRAGAVAGQAYQSPARAPVPPGRPGCRRSSRPWQAEAHRPGSRTRPAACSRAAGRRHTTGARRYRAGSCLRRS